MERVLLCVGGGVDAGSGSQYQFDDLMPIHNLVAAAGSYEQIRPFSIAYPKSEFAMEESILQLGIYPAPLGNRGLIFFLLFFCGLAAERLPILFHFAPIGRTFDKNSF